MKRKSIVFTLLMGISVGLIALYCIGCDAGKPRSKARGTARTTLYSVGGGVVQGEKQGFNIFFLVEGITQAEYKNVKEKPSQKKPAMPRSPFDTPKVIYDFDPEEIAEMKREYNELLNDPRSGEFNSEGGKRKRELDSALFRAFADADRDYKNKVRERESEERENAFSESRQELATKIDSHVKIAEDFVRAGKKCTVLIVSWELMKGSHPTQDLGPDHGIIDQMEGPNFDFPMKDGLVFDRSAGKLRIGTQAVAGLPAADGKCYILNPEMKFVPIDVQTPNLLSKFAASIKQLKNLSTNSRQSDNSDAGFSDCMFIKFTIPVNEIPWTGEILSSVDANRIELYEPKYAWEVK